MVETTHLSDSAREDGWNPLRRQFDIKAFGVNAWTAGEADAALISEHDEVRSGHEELLYNLACAEARLGETDAALGHLAEALQRSDRLIELARTDEDLDPLRGESRFDELIGARTG